MTMTRPPFGRRPSAPEREPVFHRQPASFDGRTEKLRPGNMVRKERGGSQLDREIIATGRTIYLVIFATILLFVAVGLQPWVSPAELLSDPRAIAASAGQCCGAYFGLVSNLGVIVWVATASIMLFLAIAGLAASRRLATVAFFAIAGSVTLWIGLDDMVMARNLARTAEGLAGPVSYTLYLGLGLAYLAIGWQRILEERVAVVLMAAVLFAASAVVQGLVQTEESWRLLLVEGLKFAGIALWALFHLTAGLSAIRRWSGIEADQPTGMGTN